MSQTPTQNDFMRLKILVVDDEPAMREVLTMRLESWGYEVSSAESGHEAGEVASRFAPDLVISDVVLPDVSGLDLLKSLKAGNPNRPVILMTAYGSIDAAVEALKTGAQDFLTKPIDYSKLHSTLDAAAQELGQRARWQEIEAELQAGGGVGELVGTSPAMTAVYQTLSVLGPSHASAIIVGESGTGKELIARTIHALSPRRDRPFVAINSAAIPEGLTESELFGHDKGAFTGALAAKPGCFELADKGTLFLDEISEMPIQLQPKLLRILEDGQVRRLGGTVEIPTDARIIAATNRDVQKTIEDGFLREDLYYRLNVFTVSLPPLRVRTGDLPLLSHHFVGRFNTKHGSEVEGVGTEALERMERYHWPGNVRELRNILERAVILASNGWILPQHLPPYVLHPPGDTKTQIQLPANISLDEAEKIVIEETLRRVGNNKAEAARRLKLDVKTIRNKLRAYAARATGR